MNVSIFYMFDEIFWNQFVCFFGCGNFFYYWIPISFIVCEMVVFMGNNTLTLKCNWSGRWKKLIRRNNSMGNTNVTKCASILKYLTQQMLAIALHLNFRIFSRPHCRQFNHFIVYTFLVHVVYIQFIWICTLAIQK